MALRIAACVVVAVFVLATLALGLLIFQGRRKPVGDARYVALGSSFAAGIGLGPRAPGSPIVCMRSDNGYPAQLARTLGLPLLDMSCSGATTAHVLRGGQMFQGPQLAALTPATELVTLTIGGNDVHYIGDASLLAARRAASPIGWVLRRLWAGPRQLEQRDFVGMERALAATLCEIRRRAPRARIVVATYPAVLLPERNCPRLGLDPHEAATMRSVGERLAEVTRRAAQTGGAILIDMAAIGAAHHACASDPWVNGWNDAQGTRFHPTLAGARATADAIAAALATNKDDIR